MISWYNSKDLLSVLEVSERILSKLTKKAFFNWSRDSLTSELLLSQTLVFKAGGIVSAFLLFRETVEDIEIIVLGTQPDHQKQGMMGALIGFIQNLAAEQNKTLRLEVHENNESAKRIYISKAFQLRGKRKDYYPDGAAALLFVWNRQSQPK